jgi:hypothetical protein
MFAGGVRPPALLPTASIIDDLCRLASSAWQTKTYPALVRLQRLNTTGEDGAQECRGVANLAGPALLEAEHRQHRSDRKVGERDRHQREQQHELHLCLVGTAHSFSEAMARIREFGGGSGLASDAVLPTVQAAQRAAWLGR